MNWILLACLLAGGLAGCQPRPPDLHLPYDHPANPAAEVGEPHAAPDALTPELKTIRPETPPPPGARDGAASEPRKEAPGEHKH